MMISALPYCVGYQVKEDLGFIFAYDDQMMLSRTIEDSVEEAKRSLFKKATKKGANAILSVHMDVKEKSRVFMWGQAVVLEKKDDIWWMGLICLQILDKNIFLMGKIFYYYFLN